MNTAQYWLDNMPNEILMGDEGTYEDRILTDKWVKEIQIDALKHAKTLCQFTSKPDEFIQVLIDALEKDT